MKKKTHMWHHDVHPRPPGVVCDRDEPRCLHLHDRDAEVLVPHRVEADVARAVEEGNLLQRKKNKKNCFSLIKKICKIFIKGQSGIMI